MKKVSPNLPGERLLHKSFTIKHDCYLTTASFLDFIFKSLTSRRNGGFLVGEQHRYRSSHNSIFQRNPTQRVPNRFGRNWGGKRELTFRTVAGFRVFMGLGFGIRKGNRVRYEISIPLRVLLKLFLAFC